MTLNKGLIKILNKLDLLSYLNLVGTTRINRIKFKIPLKQKTGYSNLFISEPWMIKVLEIILPIEESLFIDVGVNIGQTLLKLRSVSSDLKYIGFEPNPVCIDYVGDLVEKNSIKHTDLIPVGISKETGIGVLHFYNTGTTDSSASIVSEFRPQEKVVKKEFVPLFDLDDIKKSVSIESVSILKIDVEGAEFEVLDGFRSEIEQYDPLILIEILPVYDRKNKSRLELQNKIENLLRSLSYSIFRIKKENDALVSIDEIQEIGIHSDLDQCDYVMVPTSKKERFISQIKKTLS